MEDCYKRDCLAFREITDKRFRCIALTELICERKRCKFYKNEATYEEGLKILKNKEEERKAKGRKI